MVMSIDALTDERVVMQTGWDVRKGTKVTWHLEHTIPRIVDHLDCGKPRYVLQCMGGGDQRHVAGGGTDTRLLVRPMIGGDQLEQDLIDAGAKGAREWFRLLDKGGYISDKMQGVWGIVGPNEPDTSTSARRRALSAFYAAAWAFWRGPMWATRYVRLLSGVLRNGWTPVEPEREADLVELLPALCATGHLALHEYSAPTLQSGDGTLTFRYRMLRRRLVEMLGPWQLPLFYLTEFGVDGGVLPQPEPRRGWRDFCDWNFANYLPQIDMAETELRRDPYVECACLFNTGTWSELWKSYEIDGEDSEQFARWMVRRRNAERSE